MESNTKKAVVLGVILGLIIILIPQIWKKDTVLHIGFVVIVILIWAMGKAMTGPIDYDIKDQEFQQTLPDEDEYEKSLEERIVEAFKYIDLEKIKDLVIEDAMDFNMAAKKGNSPLALVIDQYIYTQDPQKRKQALEVVNLLIAKGADPNCYFYGRSSFAEAINNYQYEMADLLFKAGVDVNIKNESGEHQGETALHYAIKNGDSGATALLLTYGADILAGPTQDNTAYYNALGLIDGTGGEHDSVFDYVRDKKEDLEIDIQKEMIAKYGSAVISDIAFGRIHFEEPKLRVLLDDGMDINITKYRNNNTLLHEAVSGALQYELCEFLLEQGIDTNLRNNMGLTAKAGIRHEELYPLFNQYSNIENQEVMAMDEGNDSNSEIYYSEDIIIGEEIPKNLEQKEYLSYSNNRYKFSIEYPDVFSEYSESDNGDGIRLENSEAGIELLVYGANNVMVATAKELYENHNGNASKVLYKRQKDNWYVISWEDAGKGFYEKTIVGEGSMNTFRMSYPKSHDEVYSGVVEQIFNSFHTPAINVSH